MTKEEDRVMTRALMQLRGSITLLKKAEEQGCSPSLATKSFADKMAEYEGALTDALSTMEKAQRPVFTERSFMNFADKNEGLR